MGMVTKLTPSKLAKAIGLLASGETMTKTAQMVGSSATAITRAIKADPQCSKILGELRTSIRATSLERIRAVHPKVYDALDKALEAGDFKGIDQVARALRSLEVAAASAGPQEPKQAQTQVGIVVKFAEGWSGKVPAVAVIDALPEKAGG